MIPTRLVGCLSFTLFLQIKKVSWFGTLPLFKVDGLNILKLDFYCYQGVGSFEDTK
jgi:hypothetical protein